jgi:hypothetical protein
VDAGPGAFVQISRLRLDLNQLDRSKNRGGKIGAVVNVKMREQYR